MKKKLFFLIFLSLTVSAVFLVLRSKKGKEVIQIEGESSDFTGDLEKELHFLLLEPEEIKVVSPRLIEVSLKNNGQVIFSGKKDLQIQLDSLQLILSRAKMEGRKIKRLDLRFSKPVLTYE